MLIREHESLPLAYWDKSVLAFKDKIVGVHAPLADKKEHRRFYEALQRNHNCYRFAVMLNGSQALIGKATALLKFDIESLPYPDDESDLALTFWEQALADDTLQYIAPTCGSASSRNSCGAGRCRRSPQIRLTLLPVAGQPLRQPSRAIRFSLTA